MPRDSLSERDRLRLAELLRRDVNPQWVRAKRLETQGSGFDGRLASGRRGSAARRRHWFVWSAVTVTALALLVLAIEFGNSRNQESIQLQAVDRSGQLQIRWDPDSHLIRQAMGAKLFITDGVERLFVNLDGGRLKKGAVTYPRKTDRVDLRLVLTEPGGRLVEQQAIFLHAPPPNEPPAQLANEPPAQPETPAAPAAPLPGAPVEIRQATTAQTAVAIEHRARRKPLEQSGNALPFTCSAGDVFHKTDAPTGWNTFTCRGKNVWGLSTIQRGEDGSATRPNTNATAPTAKPATASTT